MATDFYSVLGVAKTATDEEIRAAYRKLAIQYHPDKTNGDKAAEEKLKVINEAYEALKTKNRAKTDREAKAQTGGYREYDRDAEDSDPYHPNNPYARYRETAYDDIFQNIYNRKRNHDIEVVVSVLLEDVFLGNIKNVLYRVSDGTQTIKVRVPIGAEDGLKIKYVAMGNNEVHNAPAGDLYVVIRILPDSQFTRVSKMNLETTIKLNPFEAILGTAKEVSVIDGSTVMMKIPPNTAIGQKFKLAGKGLRDVEGNRGSLVVEVQSQGDFTLQPDEIRELSALYEKIQNRKKSG